MLLLLFLIRESFYCHHSEQLSAYLKEATWESLHLRGDGAMSKEISPDILNQDEDGGVGEIMQ